MLQYEPWLIQELIQQARDGFEGLKICQSGFSPRIWEGLYGYLLEREQFLEIRGELLELEQFVQRLKIQHEYENGRRREEEEKSTPLAKYWEAWRDDWEEWLDAMAEWWDEYHHALWISVTVLMCDLIFVQNRALRDLAQKLAEEQEARKLLETEIQKKRARRPRISILD